MINMKLCMGCTYGGSWLHSCPPGPKPATRKVTLREWRHPLDGTCWTDRSPAPCSGGAWEPTGRTRELEVDNV